MRWTFVMSAIVLMGFATTLAASNDSPADEIFGRTSGVVAVAANSPSTATAQGDIAPYRSYGASAVPEYKNFGVVARLGTGVANWIIPGSGSAVIMRDWVGAGVQWGLVGGGYLLILSTTEFNERLGGGVALIFVSGVFNVVRSATYKKPMPKTHAHGSYGDLNLAVFPDKQGNVNAGIVYSLEF